MSRFRRYLIESEMTVPDAMKIFGISADEIGDKIALKSKYRKLSMQNHPDRGGSEEMSKQINIAYEVLFKANKGDAEQKSRIEKWKERQKKEKAMAEQLKQSLLSDFQPELYQSYFNEHSGYNFDFKIDKGIYGWPGFTVEFFTKDRNTIFSLKIGADIIDVMRGGLGSGEEFSYKVYTEAHGFHLNKKQKMSQRDWGTTRDHSFLRNPEKIFPSKKMKDIFSGKTSNRKFSKRDMMTFLTTKLKAKSGSGDYMWIPLGDDYSLVIFRNVFMRMGSWGTNGIYLKSGRVSQGKYASFMEEEQTAHIFEKIQKEAMKVKGDAKVKRTEQLVTQAYEAYKKSKGI